MVTEKANIAMMRFIIKVVTPTSKEHHVLRQTYFCLHQPLQRKGLLPQTGQ